jgi:hypothetical protein
MAIRARCDRRMGRARRPRSAGVREAPTAGCEGGGAPSPARDSRAAHRPQSSRLTEFGGILRGFDFLSRMRRARNHSGSSASTSIAPRRTSSRICVIGPGPQRGVRKESSSTSTGAGITRGSRASPRSADRADDRNWRRRNLFLVAQFLLERTADRTGIPLSERSGSDPGLARCTSAGEGRKLEVRLSAPQDTCPPHR